MLPIEHVWDALAWRIRQRVLVPANIQQIRTAIEEEWTSIPQATINNLINSMRRSCTVWGKWWSHQILTGFRTIPNPHPPPNTIKLQILEWPFIVAGLRHTCARIMLSNQHLDMPHLWVGWIISAKEECSLIFERNSPFVYIEKVFDLWVQLMKNGGKNKSVAFIILFNICIYRERFKR